MLVLQWLTLLSFTAHAVLGCCAHHEHAHPSPISQTIDAEATVKSESLAVTKATRSWGSCHCHAHQAIEPTDQPASLSAKQAGHDEHDCQQPQCHFISAPISSSVSIPCVTLSWADRDLACWSVDFLAHADGCVLLADHRELWLYRMPLRAWQQSWQI